MDIDINTLKSNKPNPATCGEDDTAGKAGVCCRIWLNSRKPIKAIHNSSVRIK